jgi:hypothetical protein
MGAPTGQTTEVLCLTTTTRLDPSPLTARDGISVYNHGPNPVDIIVTTASSPTAVINKSQRIDPEDTWGPFPLGPGAHVFGITSVDQVTGAACIVIEYGG